MRDGSVAAGAEEYLAPAALYQRFWAAAQLHRQAATKRPRRELWRGWYP